MRKQLETASDRGVREGVSPKVKERERQRQRDLERQRNRERKELRTGNHKDI